MSWWAYLEDETGEPVSVERHAEGGTYVLGGVARAELNVTYNYGARFRDALPELEGSGALELMLDGKSGRDTVELLERVVAQLGMERSEDYWEASRGNAGHAASILLSWARDHPEARWRIE